MFVDMGVNVSWKKTMKKHLHWVSLDKGSITSEHYFRVLNPALHTATSASFSFFLCISRAACKDTQPQWLWCFTKWLKGMASHEILASIYFFEVPTLKIILNPSMFLHSANSDSLSQILDLIQKWPSIILVKYWDLMHELSLQILKLKSKFSSFQKNLKT